MNELINDGWCKPRSIYRSFFSSGVPTAGVVSLVCLAVVLVCHLFETPAPEANAFRCTDAHHGRPVFWDVTLKSWGEQESSQKASQ